MTYFLRTVLLYLILIAVIRLMGKRQIGQMAPSEFVVTMLVANLAAIPLEELSIPLYAGLIPIGTVLALEFLLAILSLRSLWVRQLLSGKPVILIDNGRILQDNLRKTRVTMDELTGHLREKDVLDIGTVQFAILETNGNLSVFPYPGERPASAKESGVQAQKQFLPITIISDGQLLPENLKISGKDLAWVWRVLTEKQATIETTWLLTVNAGGKYFFYPKDS